VSFGRALHVAYISLDDVYVLVELLSMPGTSVYSSAGITEFDRLLVDHVRQQIIVGARRVDKCILITDAALSASYRAWHEI